MLSRRTVRVIARMFRSPVASVVLVRRTSLIPIMAVWRPRRSRRTSRPWSAVPMVSMEVTPVLQTRPAGWRVLPTSTAGPFPSSTTSVSMTMAVAFPPDLVHVEESVIGPTAGRLTLSLTRHVLVLLLRSLRSGEGVVVVLSEGHGGQGREDFLAFHRRYSGRSLLVEFLSV